jgi:hypothetical protein
MPPELLKAHTELDHAVEKYYRSEPFHSDRERVEFLFPSTKNSPPRCCRQRPGQRGGEQGMQRGFNPRRACAPPVCPGRILQVRREPPSTRSTGITPAIPTFQPPSNLGVCVPCVENH